MTSPIEFEHPLALLALIPLAVIFALGLRALPKNLSRTRRTLVLTLQGMLLLLVALAAAGPRLLRWNDRLAVFVLVDRSRSTDYVPEIESRLRRTFDTLPASNRPADLVSIVQFARRAETVTALSPRGREPITVPRGPSDRDGSDLGAAISHALAEVPADTNARLVLISDGDETDGDARRAALLASASGIPVDVLPLERDERSDVAATRLRAPDHVERGEPVDIALVTRSSHPARVRVELLRDGIPAGRFERTVGAGEDVVDLQDAPPTPGLHRYEARVVPLDQGDDRVPGNEIAAGYVRVAGGARAVVVDGAATSGGGSALAAALSASGLAVDRVGPSAAPAGAGEWAAYDLIVLSDVRARDLDPTALLGLRDAVRELGSGLWMMGSDKSFGPGGYAGSPVAEVLPVSLELRRHRQRAGVSLAIVIDRSGSMGAPAADGHTKLELANEAAARSASLLSAYDRITLLHVDTEVTWTLPMRTADDLPAIAAAAHRASVGGGGIYTDVGLEAAYRALRASPTTLRHVLLLADGGDAEQLAACHAITLAAAANNITTTVVAIGQGSDVPELARLSREGGGRFYLVEDARSLPQVFTEDTVLAAKSALREDPFTPVVAHPAEVLRGIDWHASPALTGYVVTESKPLAEVLLEALDHDPLLARWQTGIGRAAALTTDVDGRWSRDWLAWPGSTALMAQTGQWLARGVHSDGVRVVATAERGRLTVQADAVSEGATFDTGLDLSARIVGPGGTEVARVPLEARGAGHYEAEMDATHAGTYLVTVVRADGSVVGATGTESVSGVEVSATRGNRALLEDVASRAGGRVRNDLAGVFSERGTPRVTSLPVTREIGWIALGVLLALVAVRRVPAIPLRVWWVKARAWVRAKWGGAESAGAAAAEGGGAEDALGALRAMRRGERSVQSAVLVKAEAQPAVVIVQPEARDEGVSEEVVQPAEHGTVNAAPTGEAAKPADAGLDALVARKRARRR